MMISAVSSFYETRPMGLVSQPNFINAVAELKTRLSAIDTLAVLLSVESRLGRVRTGLWEPRTIDLDLLLYGNETIESPELTVPHPRLRERPFVIVPLAEIDPELVIPGESVTVAAMAPAYINSGNIVTVRRVRGS